jgi:membrane-bound serine protease (ClpP class)
VRHRLHRRRPVAAAILALLGVLSLALPAQAVSPGSIVVVPTTGIVDGVMADHLTSSLNAAAEAHAAAVIIELNTPGGSLESTQGIVTALLSAKQPRFGCRAPCRRDSPRA